jgi:hypothetical protein
MRIKMGDDEPVEHKVTDERVAMTRTRRPA